jgi:hypothetical protein
MCGYHSGFGIIFSASMFILASFVFSVVFWATKHWLEQKPKKK